MELRYLYVASTAVDADVAAWAAVPGAALRWRFRHFGADVAAVDPGRAPVVLVADHRPPGSVLPVYAVADLEGTVDRLRAAGWEVAAGPLGTPEGPATVLRSPGGHEIAVLRVDRPGAMESSYADPANTHAVRPAAPG